MKTRRAMVLWMEMGEESTKSRIRYTAQHCAWMEAMSHLAVMLEAAVDTDI